MDEKTPEAMQRELNAAMKTIAKLLKDISDKTEKIKSLEEILKRAPLPVVQPKSKLVVNPTSEEEIATLQLERLRHAAQSRQLTLEEVRMYDLLVKNKRLSQDESTINLNKGSYRDVSEADLLKIARPVGDTDESDNS